MRSCGERVRVGAPIEAYQAMHQPIGEPQFLEFEPTTTITFAAYDSDTQR